MWKGDLGDPRKELPCLRYSCWLTMADHLKTLINIGGPRYLFLQGKRRTKTPSTSKTPLKTLKSSFLFVVPWGRNTSWNGQGRQRRQAPITPQTGALNLGWATKLGTIWRQDLYDSMGDLMQ
ncbi:hypothetical protein AFLA70_471g000720 [Aspergillus flavus AF70]|nr:hypothetical protein AFLA70_471g000720 [Aspergillus flavus AF70]